MVRSMQEADRKEVERMMYALWPDFDGEYNKTHSIFVWEEKGVLGGFIMYSIRPWVDGAYSAPCPHIEGWFVKEEFRRRGVGKALMQAVEIWCRERGYHELTSDALLENTLSLAVHKQVGFEPTEQIQYFRKKLS